LNSAGSIKYFCNLAGMTAPQAEELKVIYAPTNKQTTTVLAIRAALITSISRCRSERERNLENLRQPHVHIFVKLKFLESLVI
jgi:hypothetical protein